jgi:hypothetical protein
MTDTEVDRREREAQEAICVLVTRPMQWPNEPRAHEIGGCDWKHEAVSRLADLAREYERRLMSGLAAANDVHESNKHLGSFKECEYHRCIHLRESLSPPEGGRT